MEKKWIIAATASGLLCTTAARGEEELEELTVVADRIGKKWIDASGSTLQTDSEDLLKMGAQDLAGFAKYDPTVSLPFDFSSGDGAFAYGQTGYGSINIRGMEGNRIAVELDGIRQAPQYISTSFDMSSDEGAGGTGRDYFDPSMFEMIEVLKGGASALYGSDALGGVVAFRTPEPEHFLNGAHAGGMVRGQFFSVNESAAFQAGGAVRQGETAFMFLGAYREGRETENNGNEPPNPSDFDSSSFLLKGEHRMGDHLFRAAFEFFERDLFVDAISAAESDFPLFDDYVHNWQHLERQRASIRWDYTPMAEWVDSVETHAYWQHSGSTNDSDSAAKPIDLGGFIIPGITRQQTIEFTTDIIGLSSVAKKEPASGGGWSQLLMVGLDISLEESENQFKRVNTGMPSDRISFAPSETLRAGIFFQDEIRIGEKWFITPGLRLDWQQIDVNPNASYLARLAEFYSAGGPSTLPEDYDNLAISPRLNVSWKPRETMQWYATYAHGVRNPTAEELSMIFAHPSVGGSAAGTLTVPNPDLQEEKSDAFEIGFKAEGKMGRFQAACYYTHYTDFIENGVETGETDPDGRDVVQTVNRGEVEIFGFELGGVWEAGSLWSQATGWQLGLSTGKSVGINRSENTWLNTVEPWKSVAFIGYDDPAGRFGARLTGVYVDEVTRVDDSTNQSEFYRPPSWFTLDLGVYWRPQETLTIHAGVNNIFDEKYWTWGSVRRGNGHLGGGAVTDRTTAPGRNFSISLTKIF